MVVFTFLSLACMFVAGIMGLKKLFLFVCIVVIIPAYFLYTPVPDGYSMISTCKMQLTLATMKTVGAVVGTFSETICNALEVYRYQISNLQCWVSYFKK